MGAWKPWYVYRPRQILHRMARAVRRPGRSAVVRLPWGGELEVDPGEDIGRAVWTTGVYDLAVSEVLWRLTPAGGLAVDAGANIGYITALMAARVGPAGRVLAFEPNPALLPRLRANAARAGAAVQLREVALSDRDGEAGLVLQPHFAQNSGIGYVTPDPSAGTVRIPTRRLDDEVPERTIDVMKMDVEGHEAAVLAGAERLLASRRVRHVVFEEHGSHTSDPCRRLAAAGYTLFQLGWRMTGPVLAPADGPRVCKPYEAPSYLATVDPAGAAACDRRGWGVLG